MAPSSRLRQHPPGPNVADPDLRAILEDLRRSIRQANHSAGSLYCSFLVWMLDFEAARNPRYADPRRLLRHAFQVTSQNGEDGIIHEIFRRIGSTDRVFAEIGVGDGNENNTAFLLTQAGPAIGSTARINWSKRLRAGPT